MKIGSLNVRGLGDFKKLKSVFNFLKKEKLDIIFLQETHVGDADTISQWNSSWGCKGYHSTGSTKSAGVAVLINPKVPYKLVDIDSDQEGRNITLILEIENKKYLFSNIYAPNTDDTQFFINTIERIEKFEDYDEIFIGGDFNLVMDPSVDRYKSTANHERCLTILTEYLEKTGLNDSWRIQNPDCRRYTWHRPANKLASRIDMIFSPESLNDIVSTEITPSVRSDHSLVTLTMLLDQYTRGPGTWKLNTKFLNNQEYIETINKVIDDTVDIYKLCTPDEAWCGIKRHCIENSKIFAKKKAKEKRNEINNLIKIKELLVQELFNEQQLDNREAVNISNAINEVNNSLYVYDRYNTESIIFRSQCKWAAEGEVSSKYFLNLEKRNYMCKNAKALYREDGTLCHNQKEILDIQTDFYKKLYTKDSSVNFNLKRDPTDPQLTVEQREYCDSELIEGEIFDAIMTLKPNKCPGLDGLPPEFYRIFYKKLVGPLLRMYTYSFGIGIFPATTRKGLISLLPKSQKDTRYVKNLRGLTILNTDYKILAKALDNRLRTVLPSIISADQTGFMAGRNIGTNIRKTLDVMEFCKNKKLPAVIMSIDMNKCFDRIDYTAVFGALKYFNFGDNFVQWLSLFYNQFTVCTQNFGFLSEFFVKERSINQGCNISPSIYLLAGEVLSLKLKNHKDIYGIRIGGTELLLSQFADDMDLYLPFVKTVLDAVMETLTDIETNIGLQISYEKTTMYRIGSLCNTDAKIYTKKEVKWSNESINTLGVDLYYENMEQNFDKIVLKMETVAKTWYYRNISLMGKVTIVNTLLSSLFVYKMMVLPLISDALIQQVESIMEKFMWAGKKAKIPLKVLKTPRECGGLGLVDIKAKHISLMIRWIKVAQSNPIIEQLIRHSLGEAANNNIIWQCNLKCLHVSQLYACEDYWVILLREWCKLNYYEPQNRENVLSQIIWLNSNILVNDKVTFNKIAINAGMIRIKDIVHMEEEYRFLTFEEVVTKFGHCTTWLGYNSIISAIPSYWRFLMRTHDLIDTHIKLYDARSKKHFSKIVYKTIMYSEVGICASVKKWNRFWPVNFNTHKKAFRDLYGVTSIIKYRNFQYRLLHDKIFCNNVLYYWGKVDSQKCDWCVEPKQNVAHLLYSCPVAEHLWKELKLFLRIKDIEVEINLENVIYNLIHPKYKHIANFLALVLKFFIFKCKCRQEKPKPRCYFQEIKYLFYIENYNAINTNQICKHNQKWSPIFPQLCT